MYLSNRDIKWAINGGRLIASPRPEELGKGYDETSIDLHLDRIQEAKIWDVEALLDSEDARGGRYPEVKIGRFNWGKFSEKYLRDPPDWGDDSNEKVLRRGPEIIVRPGGFVLWQTKERVGTPTVNPGRICFVDGKSTRARTGILVHLTAPTFHAGWSGKITLEIANVGPFHFVLQENDVIARLTVAMVVSPPDLSLKTSTSATAEQGHVSGQAERGRMRRRRA
jgi:dCTP deaminase